jgi:GT2 family glycosyltransferase
VRIIYVYDDSVTASGALNLAIARSTSRFMIIMDDDVEILTDGWLRVLTEILRTHDRLGEVTPLEIKTKVDRADFFELGHERYWYTYFPGGNPPRIMETNWNAGYIMAIDREKVTVYADEQIPGTVGMADVDISLQVRDAGFDTAMTSEFTVYHPWKHPDGIKCDGSPREREYREKYQIYQEEELPELFQQQCDYMRQKWGRIYFDNKDHKITVKEYDGN